MSYATGLGWWGMGVPFAGTLLLVILAWSIVWKGLALWRAAKRGDKIWFIVLLLVNTVGILEIIYLFAVTGAKLEDLGFGKDGKSAENK